MVNCRVDLVVRITFSYRQGRNSELIKHVAKGWLRPVLSISLLPVIFQTYLERLRRFTTSTHSTMTFLRGVVEEVKYHVEQEGAKRNVI